MIRTARCLLAYGACSYSLSSRFPLWCEAAHAFHAMHLPTYFECSDEETYIYATHRSFLFIYIYKSCIYIYVCDVPRVRLKLSLWFSGCLWASSCDGRRTWIMDCLLFGPRGESSEANHRLCVYKFTFSW